MNAPDTDLNAVIYVQFHTLKSSDMSELCVQNHSDNDQHDVDTHPLTPATRQALNAVWAMAVSLRPATPTTWTS